MAAAADWESGFPGVPARQSPSTVNSKPGGKDPQLRA